MWLSGGNRPDFRTLNLFRSSRLSDTIEDIFTSILKLLVENESEQSRYGERDLEELGENSHISRERMEQTLKSLEERLSEKPEDKKLKKAVKTLKEDYIPRQEKYKNYQKILGDRNNFSKTDTDATFMRMKEDHMKNGQLKPGYNIQAGVENQFIVHYTIHQKPTDWTTLIPHMESFETRYDYFPDNIIADAGYGNEENYTYLSEKPTTSYVKYPGYHKEKRKKRLFFIGESKRRSQTGFVSSYRSYRCENCSGRSKSRIQAFWA